MRTSEPMLGQMRLAWWRDALARPVKERPRGDLVLDGIGLHWAGRESSLAEMVDGWEVLLSAERLGLGEAEAFGRARGAFFAALAPDSSPAVATRLAAVGSRWALADAAAAVSDEEERAALVAAAFATAQDGTAPRLLRGFRGVAVLDVLATRALQRGGRPLMEGRGAALAALRGAIFLN